MHVAVQGGFARSDRSQASTFGPLVSRERHSACCVISLVHAISPWEELDSSMLRERSPSPWEELDDYIKDNYAIGLNRYFNTLILFQERR